MSQARFYTLDCSQWCFSLKQVNLNHSQHLHRKGKATRTITVKHPATRLFQQYQLEPLQVYILELTTHVATCHGRFHLSFDVTRLFVS